MRQHLTSPVGDAFDFLPPSSAMAERVRATDWGGTALGPVHAWAPSLRGAVGLCLGWSSPACLVWGPHRALIYNDACAPLLGDLHPRALAREFAGCALTAEPAIAEALERAWRGEAVCLADQAVPVGGGERAEARVYTFAFTPIRDETGAVAGVFQALTDVAPQARVHDRRHAESEAALRAANRRLNAVLESVSDLFVALDREWRITGINQRALELAHVRREDVLGRDVWATFPMYRGTALEHTLQRAMQGGEPVRQEYFGLISARWFELSIYPSAEGLSVFGRDIDERKRAERALRDSEERFRQVAEAMPQIVWTAAPDGRITFINRQWQSYTGLTFEEVNGRASLERVVHPDDLPRVRAHWEQSLARGEPHEVQWRFRRRADGAYRWFLTRAVPIRDENGRIREWFGTATDIHEQKQVEERLRESEQRFAQFMEHLPGQAWIKDRAGRLVFANAASIKAWGVLRAQVLGRSLDSVLAPDTGAQCRESDALAARTPEGVQVLESYTHADGDRRHVLVSKFAIPDAGGDAALIGGIAIDVTERMRAEEALRASELRLAGELKMMSRLHDLTTRLLRVPDLNAGLQEVLDAALAVSGTDLGNVQLMDERSWTLAIVAQRGFGREFLEYFRAVRAGDGSACARSLEQGRRMLIEDVQTDTAFAPHRDVAARAGFRAVQSTPMLSHDGRLLGVLSTHFRNPHRPSESTLRVLDLCARCAADYIERFRIEQALRESEERLRLALRGANAGVWRYDVATGDTFWSEEFSPLYGLAPSEPRTYESWLARVHPEDRERVKADFLERIKSRETEFQYELRIVHPQRGVRWILDLGRIERDAAGRAVLLSGINLDITERKQAEEALRRERELLRKIFDTIPVMITMYDPDARLLRINRAFERLVGWSGAEVAGISLMEVCYPDPAYRAEVQAFMDSCRDGWMDIRMRTRDGRDLETSWANIRLSDRTHIGIGIDITERRRAEEALRNSERLYRAIGESIDYGVWVCDPEGSNVYASDSFLRLVGMTQEQCAEFGWGEVLHPDDAVRTIAAWKECVRTGGQWDIEHRYRGVDGQWHPILARGVPVRNEHGDIIAYAGINLDIGRLKQVEEELREADRRKDRFLAVLAHELRNPLAPLRNGLEIMRLARDNVQALEQARGMMERQLLHMVRLVDDLLDLSRITRGQIELRRERVDLAVVVRHALETSRPLVVQAGHELSVRVPPEPVLVEADTIRLAQAIANLVNNAAKYTERGGRIRLAVERRGSTAEVSVQDNGVGIPAPLLPHVFEMFSPVDRPLGKAHGGLGIGLSIVKHLVEMHGGTVEARSPGDGLGSEFVIRLPLLPGPRGLWSGASADAAHAGHRPAGRRVLVADDNPDAVASLAALLELLGNDVRTARDGWEAVEVAAWFRPELALLDIGMPGLDGCGACRRIREQPDADRMTVVALTGWGQEEDMRRSQDAGFDQHLVKPVEPALLERLLAGLGGWKDPA